MKDFKYLMTEIKHYEELWDKEFPKTISRTKRDDYLDGLDKGFKFAFKTIKKIIEHNKQINELINKLKTLKKETK